MRVYVLLLGLLALLASAQDPSQTGFISIDCGLESNSSYVNPGNRITYAPDAKYIDTGVNQIAPQNFPEGIRNCYTLGPVIRGGKYLVRAVFSYGNYDDRNQPPSFDVYLGVHFWETVAPLDLSRLEIITVAQNKSLQVCLVNTDKGTPYITAIELRPLPDTMYPLVNASQSLILRDDRTNHGGSEITRYPDDPYDRIWFPADNQTGWKPINTSAKVSAIDGDEFRAPSAVLRTAVTASSLAESINFTVGTSGEKSIYLIVHCAEIRQLQPNESREFKILANDERWLGATNLKYLQSWYVYTLPPGQTGTVTYSIQATGNATIPPLLSALEVHKMIHMDTVPTDAADIDAISEVKKYYNLKAWMGDPCVPSNLTWDGLNCSYNEFENPRIISLNLSRRGLGLGISPSIANLTALTSLDLSHSNLTGEIPGDLAELPKLKFINLADNQLSGQVPKILLEKSQAGSLTLSIEGNSRLLTEENPHEKKKSKKGIILAVSIAAPAIFIFALVLVFTLLRRVRKKRLDTAKCIPPEILGKERGEQNRNVNSDGNQYTFAEILHFTKNFSNQIGKGGFGIVYLGNLQDGTQAAVKLLSESSTQGVKEFLAEAKILTRVHHRNLVSLLGYCNDPSHLALVYEFMAQGSLAKHLADNSSENSILSWKIRLRIAVDVAQGLDYLHSFCKPAIVHRDVKSTNILLSEDLTAKLADFGLSRIFHDQRCYPSTAIAGTPGYLDPEYYQTSELNEKTDVYSFGVVLLELITGQPPIINGLQKMSLVSWIHAHIERGDITAIVDQRLHGKYDINSMWKTVEVAMACTTHNSNQRPSMSDVVIQLKDCLNAMAFFDSSSNLNAQEESLLGVLPSPLSSGISPLLR
ncbi:unnamed protein product [Spirodela intermedia]|uniref:non-specific serine/threonine protein kinase n=1 Tax=Spirodela intermedia TaxID=51605 RepID=A0A7I8LJ68_SPIIN|nr:unnamed protein product [Spirodela intermedia]